MRLPNRTLFEEVNWTLYHGTRVALAGRNGCGKSTLLRIMAQQLEPTEGNCTVVGGKRLKIGFLDQTLLERAVLEASKEKERSISPLELVSRKLEATQREDEYVETEWEIRKTLSGLGFPEAWIEGPIGQLSGGWLLRVFIAEALLQKPDVLLLDEPTNHLDISSIQWLEEFLVKEFEGSLILVTHDLALQRRVTNAIAVIHGARFFYRTGGTDYLAFRESLGDESEVINKQMESLDKKIADNMEFYERFRAKATLAARAQSKLKMAEAQRAEKQALQERLIAIKGSTYNLKFSFRSAGAGAKFPLVLKETSFRYAESAPWILRNINIDLKRGQTVAILGDNGAGKTTLLNVMAERLKASAGEVMRGHAVEMGYFGQHQIDELSLEDSVLDNVRVRAFNTSIEEVRGILGAFGFGGQDEVGKKAKVLSGGEKARLAMLRILVTRVNLILLDEPTNHLDIETKELLKQAIREFDGTVVFVSHDREFVEATAERILYLSSDHVLTDHFGDLDSFFQKYPHLVRHLEGNKPSQPAVAEKAAAKSTGPTLSYEERKKVKNQVKSLEKKIAQLETNMEAVGAEKSALEAGLAAKPAESQQGDLKRIEELGRKLHEGMLEWERMSLELEKASSLLN